MQRSLFSGVTGLSSHQAILDVTANNLANISTPGFKGSRLSFATALNQTASAGSAPGTSQGGTNPRQIGLGVSTSSTDLDVRQGALLSTGRSMDLAIQGNGFFKVTKNNPNDGTYYTRVGNFGIDSNNDVIDLSSGLKVTGIQNNTEQAISLADYQSIDAKATQTVKFQGNLDSSTKALQGSELSGVWPLIVAETGEPADEATKLNDLSLFKGTETNPAATIQGSSAISLGATMPMPAGAALTDFTITTSDQFQTGGIIKTTLTLPQLRLNGAGSSVTFKLVDDTGAILASSTLSNTDMSSLSQSARTLMLDTSPNFVQAGRTVQLQVDIPAGTTIDDGGSPATNSTTFPVSFSSQAVTPIRVFGTKPDGEPYVGQIEVDPWNDDVDDLINGLNQVLTQGSSAFAQVTMSNGNLTATSLTAGSSFSMFLGEQSVLGAFNAFGASTYVNSNTVVTPGNPSTTLSGTGTYGGTNTTMVLASDTISSTTDATLVPTFTMPAFDYSTSAYAGTNLTFTVKVNGNTIQTITVPAADYTTVNRQFSITSNPLVKNGDTVSYELAGTLNLGAPNSYGFTTSLSRLSTDDGSAGTTFDGYNYRGTSVLGAAGTTITTAGMLDPTFTMPAQDYSTQTGRSLRISVRINGTERGSLTIPAGDYSGTADRTFTLTSLPHVKVGDVVTYDLAGTLDLGGNALGGVAPYAPTGANRNLNWSTRIYPDDNTNQMTSDRDGDSIADMFDNDVTVNGTPLTASDMVDVNRWQYHDDTNVNFKWYRTRFSPESVLSSIDVYDSQGTRHTLEARFIKAGTGRDSAGGPLINYWDMVANIDTSEGKLDHDLITGLRFDDQGRFVNTLNTSPRGNSITSVSSAVSQTRGALDVTWSSIGVTSQLNLDFGDQNTTRGLTGFGTPSTAAAINQDGYANGALESISVQANGDINGLYSNGQTEAVGKLQLYTFRNPAGLLSSGGNLWSASSNSGQEVRRDAGEGGAGTVTAGSLEGSNVDIASEFTRMITAQRGFQVNARVIQTTDSILQELAGLIR